MKHRRQGSGDKKSGQPLGCARGPWLTIRNQVQRLFLLRAATPEDEQTENSDPRP